MESLTETTWLAFVTTVILMKTELMKNSPLMSLIQNTRVFKCTNGTLLRVVQRKKRQSVANERLQSAENSKDNVK